MRVCVRACVLACVRACVCVCVFGFFYCAMPVCDLLKNCLLPVCFRCLFAPIVFSVFSCVTYYAHSESVGVVSYTVLKNDTDFVH